jgi:hypothetical protein
MEAKTNLSIFNYALQPFKAYCAICLFYFRLNPQCILPLCLFSLSLCITFALSFYCTSLLDLYISSTFVELLFCSLFICLCQCIIVLLFNEAVYVITRQPHNVQNSTTDISAVELRVSVMQLLAN